MVDDVFIGNRTCDPIPGGLVLGNVRDVTTGDGINGATVTSLDAPETSAKTTATPDDENLDDGFYWMFSDQTGTHPFEATANQYSADTQDVRVIGDLTNKADFDMKAMEFQKNAEALAMTASTQGFEAAKGMVQAVGGACGGCHRPYRASRAE